MCQNRINNMNKLNAFFTWGNSKRYYSSTENMFDNGLLRLTVDRINIFKYGNKNFIYNNDTSTLTAVIGYINNLDQLCEKYHLHQTEDVVVVERLFQLNNTSFFGELEGSFTIFIWNDIESVGYFFQDEFSSGIPLYYMKNPSMFFIGTNLHEIIGLENTKPELNISAARDFLIARFMIPNKNTLIRGVYKLIPGYYLKVNSIKKTLIARRISYPKSKMILDYAKSNLISALHENIDQINSMLKSKQRICTLSAGYDSNMIINYLSDICIDIQAFTIGGREKNEIPNASKLAQLYRHVKHETKVVENDMLASFPDIVWRTEGYVCESGLFMQYELANLLNNKGLLEILCGEAGDQILDQFRKRASFYRLKKDAKSFIKYLFLGRLWPERFRESLFFKYLRKPSFRIQFDTELDYIIKKNSLLMNSFGVQPIYPFVNRKIAALSEALGELNKNKDFYKEKSKSVLGEEKIALISKIGGATDIEYLFEGYETIIYKMLDQELIKHKLFNGKRVEQIKRDPLHYIELILRLLYIFVFNKIFITGKFTEYFKDKTFNISLKDLLDTAN